MGSVHRALGDLSEGMRSLLGIGDGGRPALVEELLGGQRHRRTPRRRARSGPLRAGRSSAPGPRRLVRVK